MANPEIGNSVLVEGVRTNFIEAGQGPPLVLIHGSGPGVSAYANWNGVLPALSRHFHVYAPDMIGFGYTELPDTQHFDLDLWVRHIAGFLDALGLSRASFIGNSFGGALSLALAARHPHKVRSLVLMGSAGLRFPITAGLEMVWGYQPTPESMRNLMNVFAYDPALVTEEIVQSRYLASIRPGVQESFSRLFPAPRQAALDGLATPEDHLAKIAAPALIVHGREDRVIPLDSSIRLAGLLPHAELHVFGDCGHWTQIEKRQRFLEVVIPFLQLAGDS